MKQRCRFGINNTNPSNYFPYTNRKSCFGDSKVQKSRGKSSKLSPQKGELQPGSPNQRELRSKETPEKVVPVRPGAERDLMLACKEEPEASCHIEDLPFMSTTEMYLCCWNQPPLSPLRETSPKKEEEVASEWTPHVVHDMLIVCKPNLYPIFKVPGCGFEPSLPPRGHFPQRSQMILISWGGAAGR